jgi:pterin-4a-carbinolamine dehydratase
MTVLSDREVDLELASQPGWRREDDALVREITMKDFETALAFLERVAQAAVDYQRRPDMCISEFNHIRLTVANLHHAGFTAAEMRLVAKVNAILDEHPSDAANRR